MTGKRNIGNMAAIGGMTAAVVLLTGLATAKADEMADLRANQLLLQQRIDQLAQATKQYPGQTGTSAYGNVAAPTAPSLGGSFPRSFLIPGTDTSVRVGGFIDLTILDFLQGGGAVNGSNYSSNTGQNGNLQSLPVAGGFVPGLGFVNPNATNRAPGRNNGVLTFSPQQSRFNIETRTPTSWGEARSFFEWDWAGCDNFSCQDVAQSGNNQLTRLRFAYGTLGGFLGGQAISNFSDADADTESMEFGGSMGSTGGQRIPQVRYTIAGPYGSAFSVSAENPWTTVITPGGVQASDSAISGTGSSTTPPSGVIGPICNGQPCTGFGTAQANPAVAKAPNLTFASYWSQPWGHMDFSGLLRFYQVQDGGFVDRQYVGYGGHISGDVHPNWFGYNKDDILFSFVVGNAIGSYASGGSTSLYPLATNFTVKTLCATPEPGCTHGQAASNILVQPVPSFSANGGVQHWWTPTLRSTVAAGIAQQDVSSQLIGPTQAQSVNSQLLNVFVNLVWNPVAFITTGVEYMYGQRIVVANLKGHENVLIGKFRVAF